MPPHDLSLSDPRPAPGVMPLYREPFPLAVALQALAIFAGVGASLGLFSALIGLQPGVLADFLDRNSLGAPARLALSIGLLLGTACGGGLGLLYLLIRRRPGVAELNRAANVLLPLTIVCLLPSLFTARPWHDKPTIFLLML